MNEEIRGILKFYIGIFGIIFAIWLVPAVLPFQEYPLLIVPLVLAGIVVIVLNRIRSWRAMRDEHCPERKK